MGSVFLIGYILIIGVGTFLMKYGMKYIDAYQMNLLMGLAMLAISLPAVWISHHSFKLPRQGLAISLTIGLSMAIGSILYVLALSKLPAGLTAAVATSYVVIVIILSRVILKESIGPLKLVGLAFTLAGVALLSYKG